MSNEVSNKPVPIIRGTNFGFLAKRGYYGRPEIVEEIPKMLQLGIDWVAVNITVAQSRWCSTKLYQDFEYTPDDRELEFFIRHLQKNKMKVLLRPVVECFDGVPRKLINFPRDGGGHIEGIYSTYWAEWFKSFTSAMVHYARLAEALNCEMLSLSCEMYGTEEQEELWAKLIKEVRKNYRGKVVYDSKPTQKGNEWFHLLDQIHFSFYPSPEQVDDYAEKIKAIGEKYKKIVVCGECGFRSTRPNEDEEELKKSSFQRRGVYDGQIQAERLDAILSRLWSEPWWGGLLFWKWDETQYRPNYHSDPKGDQGFTISGKPAEEVIKKWYTRSDRDHL